MAAPDLSPIAEEVRRHDPDRFLTALFAPPERREDLLAVYAFNAEVARIRDAVREPMLGEMRLQWWLNVLDSVYAGHGAPAGHPGALALAGAIERHALPRALFEQVLETRRHDLAPEPVADHAALEDYVAGTGGALARLAAWVLGADSGKAGDAADRIGRAWALVGLLRAAAMHARQGKVFLPDATIHGLGGEAGIPDDVRRSAAIAAGSARNHLAEARRLYAAPGRKRVAAFLPAVLADGHLRRLEQAHHDVSDLRLALPQRRPLMLLLKASLGRY